MSKVHKMPTPRGKVTADLPTREVVNLWALNIGELTGHNLEMRGREKVNRLLEQGWRLLHIYTLTYQEAGVWRERPMAILGRLREPQATESSSVIPTRTYQESPKASPALFQMSAAEQRAMNVEPHKAACGHAAPAHIAREEVLAQARGPEAVSEKRARKQRSVATREAEVRKKRRAATRCETARIPYTLEAHPEL